MLDVRGKKLLYNALVGSVLNYCSTILYEAGAGEVESMQLGQNAAMRYILGWGRESK